MPGSAYLKEVESRKLRTGTGSERVDFRWSVQCCEVKARRWEVIKGALGRVWTVDVGMQKERRPTVASSKYSPIVTTLLEVVRRRVRRPAARRAAVGGRGSGNGGGDGSGGNGRW